MLSQLKPYSPTPERDFIWVAEYATGQFLSEYDFKTKQKNEFYSIKKNEVIRFGLFGHGYKFYYEVFGGHLKTPYGLVDLVYKTKDKEYHLTGQNQMYYNDIITYKQAEMDINLLDGNGTGNSVINEYVFGYKQKLAFDDINFNLKVLFKIPFGSPMNIEIRLVSDKDIEGILQLKKNGIVCEEFSSNLNKNISRTINWMVT